MSLPSSPFLPPPKSAAEAPLAGGSGLEATRRVVEEALEERLLTSAVAAALNGMRPMGMLRSGFSYRLRDLGLSKLKNLRGFFEVTSVLR